MKNTKNTLFLNTTLTTALLTSFLVIGMESDQPINPYLTTQQKTLLEKQITAMQSKLNKIDNETITNVYSKIIEAYREIYYGNISYTDTELHNAMRESIQKIVTEKTNK